MSMLAVASEFRFILYPKDFYRVRKFYEETLGYSIVTEWDDGAESRGVMFNTGAATLELLSPKPDYIPVQGVTIALQINNVIALWEELKDQVTVVFDPRHNEWGDTSFGISDPEGLHITFFTND